MLGKTEGVLCAANSNTWHCTTFMIASCFKLIAIEKAGNRDSIMVDMKFDFVNKK